MGDRTRIPVSVIVLTKNEEPTLGNSLRRLSRFDEIVVVDSGSTDRTAEIAREHGARVVDFAWDGGYPKKKQWSLEHAGVRHDWVLLLDADEFPAPRLVDEIAALAASGRIGEHAAYDVTLLYRFAGRYLHHGHRVTKRSLLDRTRCAFPEVGDLDAPGIREVEGHYQPEADGPLGAVRHPIVHDDRDPVSSWFERHNRYSDWEAYLRRHEALRADVASKRTTKGAVFDRVPFKPLAFFVYSYVARMGFLDGRAGFDYAVALATYYWQIGVKVRELERAAAEGQERA